MFFFVLVYHNLRMQQVRCECVDLPIPASVSQPWGAFPESIVSQLWSQVLSLSA